MSKSRIVLVDDHPLFREGVRNLLSFEPNLDVVGEVGRSDEVLEAIHVCRPDLLFLDVSLPGGQNGLELMPAIRSQYPDVRVLMLTAFHDRSQAVFAIRSGVNGYCRKDIDPDLLLEATYALLNGDYFVIDRRYTKAELDVWEQEELRKIARPYLLANGTPYVPLSKREGEILRMIIMGKSNKEIAWSLDISHQTVKNHVTNILEKLDLQDRTQAAVYALVHGWVRFSEIMESGNYLEGKTAILPIPSLEDDDNKDES